MSEATASTQTTGTQTTAATTQATTTAATTTASAPVDWIGKFDDETKGYIANKGFKEPGDVLTAYRNSEKLHGVPPEQILKIPQKDDAPEWGGVWEKLGVPKDAKEYKIAVPEGGDPAFADNARQMFKAAGLTTKQAEALTKQWNDAQAQTLASQTEAYNNQVKQDDVTLRKEWGAAYDQEIQKAKRATQALGMDQKTVDALEKSLGFAGVMKFFNNLGSKIGEDSFIRGGSGNSAGGANGFNVLTPDQAKAKITALKADPGFTKRYVSGDVNARAELNRLHEMAYASQ